MNKALLELVEKVVEGNSKGLNLIVRISDRDCCVRDVDNGCADLVEWDIFGECDWYFGSGFKGYSELCIDKIDEMISEMEVTE